MYSISFNRSNIEETASESLVPIEMRILLLEVIVVVMKLFATFRNATLRQSDTFSANTLLADAEWGPASVDERCHYSLKSALSYFISRNVGMVHCSKLGNSII